MKLLIGAFCLLFLLIYVIIGLTKKSGKMLVTLGETLVSFIGALILSRSLSGVGSDLVMDVAIPKIMGNMGVSAASLQVGPLAESIAAIVRMVITPVLFIVLFFLLLTVIGLVCKIVFAIAKVEVPDVRRPFNRLCGVLIGLVCGVLCLLVIVAPTLGTIDTLGTVYDVLVAEEVDTSAPVVEGSVTVSVDSIMEIGEAPIAKQLYRFGGKGIFRYLTTTRWEDQKVVLGDEVKAISTIIDQLSVLGKASPAQYGEKEVAALKGAAESVDDSVLLSNMVAGVMSEASGTWKEGGSYMGISFPGQKGQYGKIMTAFFTVFSTTDRSLVSTDLGTMADVFGVLVKYDMFALLDGDGDAFANKLTMGGVVDELYAVLDANPRMAPVKVAIADAGMSVMLGSLGGDVNALREEHGELMNDMAGALKNAVAGQSGTINAEALRAETATAIQNAEVDVDDSVVDLVVDALVDEFTAEELAALSEDEIVDRLINRFGANQ